MKTSATLVFIYSLLVTSCVGSIWKKTYVEIRNDLPAGTTLTVHCKSKNDDLGIHDITHSWIFSFIPRFFGGTFGGTLFFCSFAWPGQFVRFDIYVQSRDMDVCDLCIWKISPDRPCRVNGTTGQVEACYHYTAAS